MATFSQIGNIAKDPDFQGRVQYALFVAAINVIAEAANTANHALRATYANRVLNGNVNITSACMAILTNSTIAVEATFPIANSIPDGDIQFAVNSLWNALSGVST